jgi:hypothetical protein
MKMLDDSKIFSTEINKAKGNIIQMTDYDFSNLI